MTGADLRSHRLLGGLSWLLLIVFGGWVAVLDLRTLVMANIDGVVWLLELAGALGGFGLLGVTVWSLWRSWSHRRGGVAKMWSAIQALAALMMLWVMLAFHVISFGTNF